MSNSVVETLRKYKTEFTSAADLQPFLEAVKDKKVVMLGEASHGTHEYYKWRAIVSKILLEDYGFDFVAVEGDWPACYEVNRHIKHYADAITDTERTLQQFQRWPSWMWANWEVHEWVQWLRTFNAQYAAEDRKGFYGLDVYSLWESLDAIMEYLRENEPAALKTAKTAMRCFEPHRDQDGQRYALSTRLTPEGCSAEVTLLLTDIRNRTPAYKRDLEQAFSTEQNAFVSKNAEHYYRIMASGDDSTWNLRDGHMMDTLHRLMQFHGSDAKGIVWAHNTHIGDATHTDMADAGLYNLGELGRKEYGRDNIALVGFGSHQGTVLAGSAWGEKAEAMKLPVGRDNSWEAYCHAAGSQFHINCNALQEDPILQQKILHRAVGVVYNPAHERYGNYVPSVIPQRYDHFLFFDHTQALHALDLEADASKTPDTYPFGI